MLVQAGLKDGTKVQMLGSKTKDLDGMKTVENENQRRERIMRERALKASVKASFSRFSLARVVCLLSLPRTGAVQGSWSNILSLLVFVSCATIPLPRFERVTSPAEALALLRKLSEDPAIKHVMQQHKFTVGLLTELAPHEHPELLGLNENAGQAIRLRLRTNRYDGFRTYNEVRRVLCHELTHNV